MEVNAGYISLKLKIIAADLKILALQLGRGVYRPGTLAFEDLDKLANDCAVVAAATSNTTWRCEYENLARSARALANAKLRATGRENEIA